MVTGKIVYWCDTSTQVDIRYQDHYYVTIKNSQTLELEFDNFKEVLELLQMVYNETHLK